MGKKVKSMDVTIAGVTRSYEFDPAAETSGYDESSASLELLSDAETTDVVLGGSPDTARIDVEYTVTIRSSVSVDLSDLADNEVEDASDMKDQVQGGNFDEVYEAIVEDAAENLGSEHVEIDSVTIEELLDEDGNDCDN